MSQSIREVVSVCVHLTIIVFLLSTMLSIGSGLTIRQILGPLHNARLVITSLAVSYIGVPLIAIGIAKIISLEQPLKRGLILLSLTAGSEALPKLAAIAGGNISLSVALMSMQLVVTMLYVPMLLAAMLPDVQVDSLKLLLKLLLLVFLPLVIGLLLKARHGVIAERVHWWMENISTVAMIVLIPLIVILSFGEIVKILGSGAILAGLIFILASFTAGYLLGGPGGDTKLTIGLGAGARNASIALVIASQVFEDPDVVTMVMVTTIVGLIIMLPTAYWLGQRGESVC